MALRLYNHAEQVAAHLRMELMRGRWTHELPGADRLGAELDVNHTTMGTAIRLLEQEGLLEYQGAGKPRRIIRPKDARPPGMRVTILLYEKAEEQVDYIVDLRHRLNEEGHIADYATRTLVELRMDVAKIAKLVNETQTDAWIIQSGSKPVLEWFAQQSFPAMALAGRRRGVSIAGVGPDKIPAVEDAVGRLFDLGHRRIVMLNREERRKPVPGKMERAFLQALEQRGIATSAYHLPDWEETAEGLNRSLRELFRLTPPTAMIIDGAHLYLAVERHLARMGYQAPTHISLACLDPSSCFDWFQPGVAHIRWDSRPMIQRIVRWAHQVAGGNEDIKQTFTKAEFMASGTIGPAPKAE
ncbi:MAG TPA: substrate-binding domain-containing protein [Luteolibacter sp.]|nr:substrate-binding domain-containing protein [Luteolibacter sp.]